MSDSWLVIILGACVAALIGALIGQARGRPGAGAFWSLFLGPIGWLIIILGPDYRLKCPECGGVIDSGVHRCKHCGVDFMKRRNSAQSQARHKWDDAMQDLSDIPDDNLAARVNLPGAAFVCRRPQKPAK